MTLWAAAISEARGKLHDPFIIVLVAALDGQDLEA